MSESILHILNLDTVGGVEELFIHFLSTPKKISSIEHHVLITGSKVHPFFRGRLNRHASSVTHEKYLFGYKLPKFLRKFKRKKAVTESKPDHILLWNRIEPIDLLKKYAPNATITYYEHGASWILPKSKKFDTFFSTIDKFLVNSFSAKRVLEEKWHVKGPITILENPIKPILEPRKQAKTISKKITLGYIGRLIPLKGIPLLFHAIKALDNAELLIAGDGMMKDALISEAKKCAVSDRVHFCGCIQDVVTFYDKLDVLLIPSIREPLGLIAIEAQLRGVPVIGAKIDGLAGVCKAKTITPTLSITHYPDFGGNLVQLPDLVYNPETDSLQEPKILDPRDIQNAIVELTQDSEYFQLKSQEAIDFAKKRISFDDYTKALYRFL